MAITPATNPQHQGRAGWSWYTGAAGWLYRAGLDSILGLRRHGKVFEIDPCIPSTWAAFSISWRIGKTRYHIRVENPEARCRGVASVTLDGRRVEHRAVPIVEDEKTHEVHVVLGEPVLASAP